MTEVSYKVENGVLHGKDGWLFLFEGSNMVSELFFDPIQTLGETIAEWQQLLLGRRERIEALGAKYFHFWAPDKFSVYPEYLPDQLKLCPDTPAQVIQQMNAPAELSEILIDMLPAFHAAKAGDLLYWKTDTHWTYEGALVAYHVLCNILNTPPILDLMERPRNIAERVLDLGGKISPKKTELCHFVDVLSKSKISYKNELVRFIELLAPQFQGDFHLGTSVGFKNLASDCDPRKVLIFGDSYCEYRPTSLSALLGETFEQVQFVWSARVDYRLIEQQRPDVVLTINAERFMRKLPPDDLDISRYPYVTIASFLNKRCRDSVATPHAWTFK